MSRRAHARGSSIALGIALLAAALTPQAVTASPAPAPTKPGGLAPQAKAAAPGDGVHIVKSTTGASCTGYSSQTRPPSTIRVLVHGNPDKVETLRFQDYVDNVLPNEWIASWDTAAIESGAVAVKSYAWYWVNHYGGYLQSGTTQTCFDVTDDTNFQVYKANSANPRTNNAVLATWNLVAQKNGQVPQTSYRASLSTNPPGPEPCGKDANGTTMSQYGSQACAEAGYSFERILQTYYSTSFHLVPADNAPPAPADFAQSGRSTPALYDPSTGTWAIRGVTSAYHFGARGDIATVSDAGDGRADIGVFRPSNGYWYTWDLLFGDMTWTQWGTRGDIPVQAHYDGVTEPTDRAVFRPANGNWYIRGGQSFHFGTRGDIPVPGAYLGTATNNHAAQAAVYRPWTGTWYVRGAGSVQWGASSDVPTPADYNGDGQCDIAVYRQWNNTWYIREAAGLYNNVRTFKIHYGAPGDIPVTGDFNGDGKADIAVYRPSNHTWYVYGYGKISYGSSGYTPVEAAPYHG